MCLFTEYNVFFSWESVSGVYKSTASGTRCICGHAARVLLYSSREIRECAASRSIGSAQLFHRARSLPADIREGKPKRLGAIS